MKMMMQKEASVNLPINVGVLAASASMGAATKPSRRTEPQHKEFSGTLSAELDKAGSGEIHKRKEKGKQNADMNEQDVSSVKLMGLPLGLAIELPAVVIPLSQEPPAEPLNSSVEISMESSGELNVLPLEINITLAQLNSGPTQLQIAVSTEKTEISFDSEQQDQSDILFESSSSKSPFGTRVLHAGENPDSKKTQKALSNIAVDGPPAPVSIGADFMNGAVIKPAPIPDTRPSPESVQVPRDQESMGVNPENLPDSLTVEVSQVSQVSQATQATQAAQQPKTPTIPLKSATQEVPDESKSEALIGTTVKEAVGNLSSETQVGDLPQKALDQMDSEPFHKTELSSDSTFVTPPAFDKVLNTVVNIPAPNASTPTLRQDLQDVVRQVMDGINLTTEGVKSSQVIITLKPEHLGQVTVKINVDGDRITAAFHAASSEVRAVLESSLPQLRQEMSHQGWNFDSGGVFAGMQEFLANQHDRQSQAHQEQLVHFARRVQKDDYDGIVAFTNKGRLQVLNATEVDYRV